MKISRKRFRYSILRVVYPDRVRWMVRIDTPMGFLSSKDLTLPELREQVKLCRKNHDYRWELGWKSTT